MIDVKIHRDSVNGIPCYATTGSAGVDLRSAKHYQIPPGNSALVQTGYFIEIPPGYVGMTCPRSGLAVKFGITVLNGPGIVDSDYRGEVLVALINLGKDVFNIDPGDRIAQMVFVPFSQVNFLQVESLSETIRHAGGMGSTGVK